MAQHIGVEPGDAVLVLVEDLGRLLRRVIIFHHHVSAGKAEAAGLTHGNGPAVGAHELHAQAVVYLAYAVGIIFVEQRRGARQRAAALAVAAAVQYLGAAAAVAEELVYAQLVGDVQLVAAAGGVFQEGQVEIFKFRRGLHVVVKRRDRENQVRAVHFEIIAHAGERQQRGKARGPAGVDGHESGDDEAVGIVEGHDLQRGAVGAQRNEGGPEL